MLFSPLYNTPTLHAVQPDITQRQPVGLAGGQLAEAVSEMLAAAGEQTSLALRRERAALP